MIKLKLILYFLFISFVFSCTEPYNRDLESYEQSLVVEGMITTEDGPYTVKIKNTVPLSKDTLIVERNAVVTISDNEGNYASLNEVSPGVYKTSANGIKGKVGNEYILTIRTEEGNKYQSNPVKLREGPGIDSVFATKGTNVSYETGDTTKGIHINVTTKEWNNKEDYYLRWEYEETWKVRPIYYDIDTQPYETEPCWNIGYNTDIILENTNTYTANKIERKPLLFLSKNSGKPYRGYSLLVKQYVINKSVYQFYKMLEENNEENGNIFDNVPYNAVSNIECCNNGDKKVFGYFDAADIDSRRTHFVQPVKGMWFRDAVNIEKQCLTPLYMNAKDFRNTNFRRPVYVVGRDSVVSYFHNKACVDCSVYATTTEKPSFWDYD